MTTRAALICGLILCLTFLALSAPQSSDTKKQAATQQPATPPSQDAQNSARQEEVVKIGVTLVQIDAIVTDKQGRQVTDLNKDDFEIYEDGKRQLITNFSYFKTEAAAAPPVIATQPAVKGAPTPPPVPLKPSQVRRSIAIVVDVMPFAAVDATRDTLRQFVDEQMEPGDMVAIVRTSRGMGALQRFTADKQLLHEAVNHIRWIPTHPLDIFEPITPVSEAVDAMERRGGNGKPDDLQPKNSGSKSSPIAERHDTLGELRDQLDVTNWPLLMTLNSVARAMQEMPGRKSIILFSQGFDMAAIGPWKRDQLRLAIERLNRAGVSVYTIDSRGLVAPMITAEEDMTASDFQRRDNVVGGRMTQIFFEQGGLEYISHETGGLTFFNRNKLSDGVRQALGDQNGYYLLGYVPQESSFQRNGKKLPAFRKLTIKVKRAGLRVRSRSGYLGAANDEIDPPSPTTSQQLIQSTLSPFNSGDVRLRMTPLFGLDERGKTVARALLHVDVRDLSFSEEADGSRRATLEVAAYAVGERGAVREQIIRTYKLQVPKEAFDTALQQGFVCAIDLPVRKPGLLQLNTAVRDRNSGRLGSANELLTVPDLKRGMALSGIALSGKDWTADEGTKAASSQPAGEPSGAAVASKANAAVRQFQLGSQMHYTLEVYNATLDAAAHRPRLTRRLRIWRDGKVVMETPAAPLDLGEQADWQVITIAGSLTLTQAVKPGQYAIEVVIEDELAAPDRRAARQLMDFEVVN